MTADTTMTGTTGELVMKFLNLLFHPIPTEVEPRWADLGLLVAVRVGGAPLFTPSAIPPRDRYRAKLQARLMDLVAQGFD